MEQSVRDRLDPLPPSAKLVYYVLERCGRLDQTGLAEETRLSTRTVRFAVDKLSESDLVREGLCPTDARRSVYEAVTDRDAEATDSSGTTASTIPVER